jgi:hypothetical protein
MDLLRSRLDRLSPHEEEKIQAVLLFFDVLYFVAMLVFCRHFMCLPICGVLCCARDWIDGRLMKKRKLRRFSHAKYEYSFLCMFLPFAPLLFQYYCLCLL